MSTTSLTLPDELKQRVAAAAQESGVSTDAFMVDAIRQATDAVEHRSQFVAQALAARSQMLQSGVGHDANQVRAFLRQHISNQQTNPPEAKQWRK
jgi:predicted transcriptional regulator